MRRMLIFRAGATDGGHDNRDFLFSRCQRLQIGCSVGMAAQFVNKGIFATSAGPVSTETKMDGIVEQDGSRGQFKVP